MAGQRREEERRRQRPRESQLEAALEGVRDMAEWQATVASETGGGRLRRNEYSGVDAEEDVHRQTSRKRK